MKFLVTDIEFDFEDSLGELSYDEQIEIRDQHLGVWEADSDDDMIDDYKKGILKVLTTPGKSKNESIKIAS